MTSSSSSSANAPKELSWFERIDNCNRYPYRLLAEKLERCENDPNLKSPDKVDLLFDEYLAKLCDFQSFYPFLRLVAPEVDGRGYGMKAKEVTKMYAELLGMQANTDQYRNLMNEKSALDSSSRIRQALETMKGSLVGHSEKTIGEVNALLDSLAAASKTDRKSIFRDIFLKFPPLEQKWIVRLILRDHKIGVKITTILPQLHRDANSQFQSNTSMIYISSWLATKAFNKAMSEGDTDRADSTSGHGGRIIPLNPFQPMLAARGDKTGPILNSVMEMVRDKPFVCDEKMDGERMLFHKKGRQVSFYTRRGNNYTDKYQVLLRSVGKICEVVGIDDVILDGEVLAWDKRVEEYVPFGQNRSVGNREIESAVRRTPAEDEVGADNGNEKDFDEGDHRELRYVLFDCVYIKTYNDENEEDEDNARASYPKVYSTTIEGNYGHRSKGATAEEILRMAHGNAVQERRMAVEEARKVGHLLKGGSLTQLPLAIRRATLVYIMQQAKDLLVRDGTLSSEDGDKVRIVDHCDFPFDENTGLMPPVAELSAEVNNYFSNICEDGGEGAVVKTWDSTYLCGEYNRNKGRWMKMKPDHDAGGGISDLDVAIIGAYHGKDDGRLSTKWGSFLVAVRQNVPVVGPDGKEDGSGVHYMGFGKVGNGISVLERDQIKRDMESRGVCREIPFEQWRDEGAPPGFEQYVLFNGPNCSLPKKDWPHVFWPPFGDSEVHYTMTVQCAELYPSSSFPTGITCRFAHCTAMRTDKLMWQIIDYGQLENLRKKHIVDQTVRDNLASNKASGKAGKSQRRRSRQVQSDFLQDGHQASGLVAEAAGGALLFDKMTFHVDVTGSFSDGGVLRATSPAAMASVKDPPIPRDTRARAEASDLWCVMYSLKSIAIFGAVNEYLDRLQKIKDAHPHFGCGINENLLHPITKERGTLGWTSSTPAAMRTILHRELNKVGEKPVILFYENPDVPWPTLTRQTSARDVARQESLRQSPPLPTALNPSSSSSTSSASKAAGATIAAGKESGAKSKTEEEMTAQKLANLIKVHGGSLEATAKSESAVIVVGPRRPMSISLMNAIRNGDLDIISYEWILESIDRARADLQKGKAPRVLKSFVFKHLLAPSIDSVNNLGTIARNEFGEKMGKKPGEVVVMEGAEAQRLCAGAMGHGLRVVRRARGDQVSADSKAHAQAMKVDIEQLYGLGGRGCRDWREITQASLELLPRLGEDSLARAQLVIKRQREGDNTEGDAMEVSAECDNGGHTGGEEAEDRDALANLVHTVAPLWSQDVVVWSVNSPPPHDDAYHDMIVAAMQSLGCTIPPSEQIDDKNFRWRDSVGGPLGSVSHILVPPSLLPSVLSRLEERIESKFSRNGTKKRKTARPYIVNTGWAERCVEQEQIVSTEGFVVTSGGTHGN